MLGTYINLGRGSLQARVEHLYILLVSLGVNSCCHKLAKVESSLDKFWVSHRDSGAHEGCRSVSSD
jgi:hypothetical protein